ncbi:hypothetical protein VB735_34250, partial [Halotia wernerae UHCC 0503]|nr:hypothetical protein [Halotia wernerae UHCC 0503]
DSVVKSWARTFIIWLISPVTFFILFLFYSNLFPIKVPYETTKSLEKILEQTGWTNTKLQRVERNLGTDPNQRRR